MTAPEDSQRITVALNGLLTPVTLPELDFTNYMYASQAATDAVSALIGATDPEVDFHVLCRAHDSAPVLRNRWKVDRYISGPSLLPGTTDPYPTQVGYQMVVWPLWDRQQLVSDPGMNNWPYQQMQLLEEMIPLLLLRNRWDNGPGEIDADGGRLITVGSYGTARFTPQRWSYESRLTGEIVDVPYRFEDDPASAELGAFRFVATPGSQQTPQMWVAVTTEPAFGHKVSYLVQQRSWSWGQRWDDPTSPLPAFEPLPWPGEEDEPGRHVGPAGGEAARSLSEAAEPRQGAAAPERAQDSPDRDGV